MEVPKTCGECDCYDIDPTETADIWNGICMKCAMFVAREEAPPADCPLRQAETLEQPDTVPVPPKVKRDGVWVGREGNGMEIPKSCNDCRFDDQIVNWGHFEGYVCGHPDIPKDSLLTDDFRDGMDEDRTPPTGCPLRHKPTVKADWYRPKMVMVREDKLAALLRLAEAALGYDALNMRASVPFDELLNKMNELAKSYKAALDAVREAK